MTALAAAVGICVARHGGLLTGVGYHRGERRVGWVLCALAVACGYVAGKLG